MPNQILIVDDDPQIHRLLSKVLPSPQYQLSSAFSAEQAYEILTSQRPDMVILDIMMPKVSGMQVCHFMKQRPELRDIQILILSAKDAQTDRLDGLAHGADDYVAKPFHMQHLVRKIEHMLAREPQVT